MMSSFFLLNSVSAHSVDSFIITSFRTREQQKMFNKANFSFSTLGKMNKPIETMLTSSEEVDSPEFLPCLSWDAGRPNCNFIVMNERLKKIFQTFTYPSHQWTEVEVRTNEILSNHKETRIYWMLQVVMDKATDINYQESLFVSKPIGVTGQHPDIRFFEKGEIDSLEQLKKLRGEEFKKIRYQIYPKTLVLNTSYSVLPHFTFGVIFNQEVKDAIVAEGLGGEQEINFKKVDYEIIMPSPAVLSFQT